MTYAHENDLKPPERSVCWARHFWLFVLIVLSSGGLTGAALQYAVSITHAQDARLREVERELTEVHTVQRQVLSMLGEMRTDLKENGRRLDRIISHDNERKTP